MGVAARIFERDPKGEFREMIHDEVDKWVDQIIDEVFEDGKEPTVMDLSDLFSKTKKEFFGACFQALIEQKYAGLFYDRKRQLDLSKTLPLMDLG